MSSKVLLSLLLALAPGLARAGACCVGSTSTVPLRLGECERRLAGFALAAETSIGQWTGDGESASSSLRDDALIGTLGLGLRVNRRLQFGLAMPARLNHKVTSSQDAWGGGAGDLRVLGLWDPMEERPAAAEGPALPVPILTFGLRAPTGRSWAEAEGAMGEDVTGLEGPAALLGLSVERTLDRVPWSLSADAELGADGEGAERHLHPALTGTASVGRYVGTRWSLNATLSHQRSWVLDPSSPGSASRTSAGLKVASGRPLRSRAWLGVESDLPVSGLGRSNLELARAGLGVVVVR